MSTGLDELVGRRPGTRGRIVMLSDNQILGDSRVQKEAESAAAAGWDVVLLGTTRKGKPARWQLGAAEVVLVPTAKVLAPGGYAHRRALLRRPLAYPPGRLADYRARLVAAKQSDLRLRRATAEAGQGPRAGALFARRASLKVQSTWVGMRVRQSRGLATARAQMTSPLDRFTTRFWQTTMGGRAWRRLDPGLRDLEVTFGPVIDRLRPDIVHANDFRMLGVGAAAVLRGRAAGRDMGLVWDAHEFLPGIRPWNTHPRWHLAQVAHEAEWAPYADAVVTVSDELADLLAETHHLSERPTVVLNAPSAAPPETRSGGPVPGLRAACGLDAATPLAVYSGSPSPQRGVEIMVRALPRMPDLHVAFVVGSPNGATVAALKQLADSLGVSDRLHVVPYVAHDEVVGFLASADVGVIPIHHWPNHEIALITKFFEYSHARLPIVVSDVRTMAAKVRETGQGEVFVAEDLDAYVDAVTAVLADPQRYRAAYDVPGLLEGWTWERQSAVLDGVYSRVAEHRRRA